MMLKCLCDYCGIEGATVEQRTKTQGTLHYHRECYMLLEPTVVPYMCRVNVGDRVLYKNYFYSRNQGRIVAEVRVDARRLYVVQSDLGDLIIMRRSDFIKSEHDVYGS